MAKPPKRVPGNTSPDDPLATRRPLSTERESTRLSIETLVSILAHTTQSSANALHEISGDGSRQSSVLVNKIPVTGQTSATNLLQSITWPADRMHQLHPFGSESGLFTGPQGDVYAHVENLGHIRVERHRDGRYQIPDNVTPKLPALFLYKSERQATWNFARPDWLTQEPEQDTPETRAPDMSAPVTANYLDPEDAARLSPAQDTPDGLRYDRHRKTYVDTANGTVMVRKNAIGEYQLAYATVTGSPEVYFQRIANTKLWRHKTPEYEYPPQDTQSLANEIAEPAPGGVRRTSPQEAGSVAHALTANLLSTREQVLNLPHALWRKWGKTLLPPRGQHVEIDGLNYRVVAQKLNAESQLVYLQHPLFSPALYDAFEEMLRDTPSLQPKWAINRFDRWIVQDSLVPFEMPITQYICRTFKYLSDQSVNALARAMFDEANNSEIITGEGLATLNETFRYWADRNSVAVSQQRLADPLLMLRDLSSEPDADYASFLEMPFPGGADLRRLDLDPGRFPQHWNEYAASPTPPRLCTLFRAVLEDDGYAFSPTPWPPGEEALLFYRESLDAVFVLKLPAIINGRLHQPRAEDRELPDYLLPTLTGRQQQTLASYRDSNRIIYLFGGIQTDALGQTTLFIIRKRRGKLLDN